MSDAPYEELLALVTRRQMLVRGSALGLGALVLAALPAARAAGHVAGLPVLGDPGVSDAALQAFADTMIPGRKAAVTDLGNAIHPLALAGVDDQPGAVEADALALYHHPDVGFDALAGAFLSDLELHSLSQGGDFLDLGFNARVRTCVSGLAFANPTRLVWEAAAAVPFTAFCAAALIPNATADRASGYRVMGLPGTAPRGYRGYSYGRRLSTERTRTGSLP